MRMLNKNMRLCYYSLPVEETLILDEDGFETLETEMTYTTPTKLYVNYSSGKGEEEVNAFGNATDYSKVMAFDHRCPLVESAILWIDTDLVNSANYKVVRIAKGINTTLVAIREIV